MDEQSLISRINIIYENELLDLQENRYTIHMDSQGLPHYKAYESMLKLYSIIEYDTRLREAYIKYLDDDLLKSVEKDINILKLKFASTSRLSFFLLIKLDRIEDALETLDGRAMLKDGFLLIITEIGMFLKHFGFRFTIDQLVTLEKVINNHPNRADIASNGIIEKIKDQAISIIKKLQYEQVDEELNGVNLEINSDKERVTHWFDKFGFKSELGGFLNNLDRFLNSSDQNIASGMISNFRVFMEDFVEALAKRIAGNEKIPRNKDETPVGSYRRYLQQKLELTDDDNGLIKAFVKILHEEGGHSMVSEKEHLRLTRNIGIEIVLFLLTRYKEKFE
jgi:hypothetical protein